jgi:hypothetical protein
MKKYFLLAVIVFSANSVFAVELDLQVRPIFNGCKLTLEMELKNVSGKMLMVNSSAWPWNNDFMGAVLSIQRYGTGDHHLKQIYGLGGAGGTSRAIQPEESVKGSTRIDGRFSTFIEESKLSDLVLYWNYTVPPVRENLSWAPIRFQGAIHIPRCIE